MASFRSEDADWFFGREELIRTLVDRLAGSPIAGEPAVRPRPRHAGDGEAA
ncbi:hypothetical protein ABT186_35495 [Streptomyces sp. NPDC001634]|uniref:hypothetical protein n=1 Tax=Streptomyces sp. NPDC001634 TaxID=3154390 RepID=UPI003326731B